jgi:hypothetical protein
MALAVDLCCGLGGWTEGLLAEGWDVIGYDIEEHVYGEHRYPANLVLRDILTLHGSELSKADLIVASPPCQEYSYMAMPWTRAKQIARALRGEDEFPTGYTGSRTIEELNALFNACFRIQREACDAAGRHIPMVVENVRGAVPWVGRSRWNFGSYHLWGDVPALMPRTIAAHKVPTFRFDGSGGSFQSASVRRTDVGNGVRFTSRDCGIEGVKQSGISGTRENGKGDRWFQDGAAQHGSKSPARKAASAMIAKIPLPLSRHIARTFKPDEARAA